MTSFTELLDLASERLGGAVIYANDDFFAEKENLLKPRAAVFLEHEYTDRGKWMDGWESRRRRVPGHDYCLVRLHLEPVAGLSPCLTGLRPLLHVYLDATLGLGPHRGAPQQDHLP